MITTNLADYYESIRKQVKEGSKFITLISNMSKKST